MSLQLCLVVGLSFEREGRGEKVHKESGAGLPLNCLHVRLGTVL